MSDNEKTPSLIIDEKQQLDSNKSILSDTAGTIYSQSGLYIWLNPYIVVAKRDTVLRMFKIKEKYPKLVLKLKS